MNITLFHSVHSEASRDLVNSLGGDGYAEDSVLHFDGMTIRVVGSHTAIQEIGQPFRATPTVLYVDSKGGTHTLEFPYNGEAIKLWAEQIERSL